MNRFTASLRIELSSTMGRGKITTQLWPRRRKVLFEHALEDATPEAALQVLGTALTDAQCGGVRTSVVIGNEWARLFMATAPRNADSRRDCEAAAQLRFQQLYGDHARDW